MAEDSFPVALPESSDLSDSDGQVQAVKVPFHVPGEGYVVPRGTYFRSPNFGNMLRAELEYYKPGHVKYHSESRNTDVNPLNFIPTSKMPNGRSAIHYRFFGPDGKWSGWMDTGWFHVAEPTLITAPADSLFITTPTFSGTGDSGYLAWAQLRNASNNENLSNYIDVRNNRWELKLYDSLPTGFYEVYAAGGGAYWQVESRSPTRKITIMRPPTVTSPAFDSVVAQNFTLTGTGLPGALVDLYVPGGGLIRRDILVKDDGVWSTQIECSNEQANAHWWLTAVQRYATEESHRLLTDFKVRVMGAPVITSHSSNQEVEMQITVRGTVNALFKGGTVEVRRDVVGTVLGSGNVNTSTGEWQAVLSQRLIPGRYNLTAVQVMSGKTSLGTSPVSLKVRPPVPTITSQLNGETVTLSGTGYNGTDVRMDVHFNSGGASYLEATVTGGSWTKVVPADLVPGNYRFGGRQSVPDGGSGRIFSSGWASEIAVNVPTPKPTGVTVTVNGQRATFKGVGRYWADPYNSAVAIFHNNALLDGVPGGLVRPGGDWETTSTTNIPPGNYTLTARLGANNQWSADSATFPMTVETPDPEFTEPQVGRPVGQRPQIKGNAWPGAQVTLKIPGMADVTVPANGGVFVRNAAEDWAPGTHTITARATFGGRTSLPATRTFTVKTPLPTITTAANEEVDLSPVIKGTGYKNCWVVIHSAVTHQPIGAGPVGPDGKWSVTLVDQAPQNLSLYAVQHESQQNSSNPSEPTAVRTVKVRVAKPLITIPAQNGKPTRTSEFSGTGQYPGTIELSIKGQAPFLKDIEVQSDGFWKAIVTLLAGGPFTLEAKSRQRGYLSEALERVVTVVPAVPTVDSPRTQENLGKVLQISGYGHPGDTNNIYRRGRYKLLGQTPVLADGTWSTSIVHEMIATDGISVSASAGAGLDSALSPMVSYNLLGTAPAIIEPQSGDWVGVRPLYSGLATPGASITVASWFNADDVLAPVATADAYGRWSVVGNKDLREGVMRVGVHETLDGIRSQRFESARFMVERKAAGFEAPSVHYPLTGQSVGRYPMFSGTGEPGAEVVIAKDGSPTTELGRARVDRDGRWALRSQVQLPVAATPYSYSVHQSRDGVNSGWLLPTRNLVVTQVTADFEPPVIDEPVDNATQILEQRPLFSGRGLPGAELKVYRHGTNTVLATTRVDAAARWSVRCQVELAEQAAAHQVSARQNMDDQQSQCSAPASFKVDTRLALFVVSSPTPGADVSPHVVFRGTAMPDCEVRLYMWGDPAAIRGRGMADAQGHWVIVTNALPMGLFEMGGRVYKGVVVSPALPKFELNVIDGG